MGKNSKKLSKIRRKNRRSGERLFQELLRVQPNACIEDYYQNGQWWVDILQIDRELIDVHRCECRARLGKGVPVPPCQSGGGKGWQGDGWQRDRPSIGPLPSGGVTGTKAGPQKEKRDTKDKKQKMNRKPTPRGSVARASKRNPFSPPPTPQGQFIYRRSCLNCGAEAEQNHRFCPFCGYQLHMIRGEAKEEHGEDVLCPPELLSGFEIGDAVEFHMQLSAKGQPRATSVSS